MADHDKHDHHDQGAEPWRAIAALFQSREEARAAIKGLHKADYKHTWLGTTSIGEKASGEETVTVETGGFFAGSESLVDSLVKRGVPGESARMLESYIEPGNAVLTVDMKDREPQEAIDVITLHGGRVAGQSSADAWGAWPSRVGTTSPTDSSADEAFEEITYSRR